MIVTKLTCDGECSKKLESYSNPPIEMFERIKLEGWTVADDATYGQIHFCPECAAIRAAYLSKVSAAS